MNLACDKQEIGGGGASDLVVFDVPIVEHLPMAALIGTQWVSNSDSAY